MIDRKEKATKNYKVVAYVLLKVKFDQPTKDVYQLAKTTDNLCRITIKDARKKSNSFRNWFEENTKVSIHISEDTKKND